MWRLYQSLIVFAVLASNIYYELVPEPYLAALIAFVCAYWATVALSAALNRWDLRRRKRHLTTQHGG
jgi:hypothetical protein